jgi:hypothetical protein
MAISRTQAALVIVLATVLALAVTWLASASAYWSGTILARWPWTIPGELLALVIGTAAFLVYPFKSHSLRAICTMLYFAGLCVAVFFTGFFTACGFGDCL